MNDILLYNVKHYKWFNFHFVTFYGILMNTLNAIKLYTNYFIPKN